MRTCVVVEDLASDSTGENYLTVPVCDYCFDEADDESIIGSEDFDPMYGDCCHFCQKS